MTLERVLITGGGGQLASDLQALLAPVATVLAPARAELDITDDDRVRAVFAELQPTTVYNCAAFHNVDVCEREEGTAFAVNATAVKRLAERCADHGARLVHLSTNYVFDGAAGGAYAEDATPSPRSVYAISKVAGEYAALSYAPGALVVRTAGLYGLHGSASKGGNFVVRMLARGREQRALRMVADQCLNPTSTADLAAGLVRAGEAGLSGVAHLTNAGACSWHEFTAEIMGLAGLDIPVEPVATARVPGAADRPLNGALASTRLGIEPLRHWREALAEYMERAGLVPVATA
jgi:dTDP-4-dehydrorhamnose reductase